MEVDEIDQGLQSARGSKRPAEDDRESDRRLTKKFRSLSLRNDGGSQRGLALHRSRTETALEVDEAMHLDTENKVYIHDLDEELKSLETTADIIAFLPEIEKRLTAIPKALLSGPSSSNKNKEVVLYHVPSSITLPEEQDSVRRAIIETRARARAKRAAEAVTKINPEVISEAQLPTVGLVNGHVDPDEMDIG